MKKYSLVNNVMGWLTFLVAAVTYCLTIEPTASFWDCPEFILSAFKLEVGHPPGAPFFMLLGNFFSQFAGDVTRVAAMINTMNALLSAATILFLFWSITHLARKLVCTDGVVRTTAELILVQGSGLVGALAYTWSDTFWYSAVEGEVYAFSSLFTALVFWLILKWEDNADKPHSDRWLVLIAYCTGLSIGVHLLNLLSVPAIVLVYYYKKRPNADAKGSLIALGISFIILAAVLYGVVPGIVKVGGWFELLFVNTLGFGYNSGFLFYVFLLIGVVAWAIYESYVAKSRMRMIIATTLSVGLLGITFVGYGWVSVIFGILLLVGLYVLLNFRRNKEYLIRPRTINTTMICLLMLMIGYSSYALIVIRSSANTPMDQNSPEDVFTLGQYLNREQYDSRPLLYGPAFTSQPAFESAGNGMLSVKRSEGAPIYQRVVKQSADEKDRYVKVGHNGEYQYVQNMFFPRMYSDRDGHPQAYESWMGGIEGRTVPYDDPTGRVTEVTMPTQFENLYFFFSYQVNFMYWRYFMWNFAGRQNDLQGFGELEHGNWITGIPFFDNARLGNQDLLPDSIKDNNGHNVFYMLPLILGLLGLFWQAYRGDKGVKQFWVVFFLFFMTGLAIVIYLNQTPGQPRERDYAYAASFYAFAIWIGLGVAALASLLKRCKLGEMPSAVLATVLSLIVPLQMVSQTLDDHDRSGRYTAADFGYNYLNSTQQKGNPIIFCNGDNDTFPLWYNQEVEGNRTDARVCNLSYLQTDWYIDQMRRPAYNSPALPITWSRHEYATSGEITMIRPEFKEALKEYGAKMGRDPFELKFILEHCVRNPEIGYIPTDTIVISVDKAAVLRSGMLVPDSAGIPEKMVISLDGMQRLTRAQVMMLELLAQTNWERPMYVAATVGSDSYFTLGSFFVQEGLASRITPFKTGGEAIDTDKMFDNMMNRFKYGNLAQRGLYLDETVTGLCYTHRRMFALLAKALINEGDFVRARQVLEKAEKVIPTYNVPNNYRSGALDIAKAWLLLGEKAKSKAIYDEILKDARQHLTWYASLSDKQVKANNNQIRRFVSIMALVSEECIEQDPVYSDSIEKDIQKYINLFQEKL